MTNFLRANLEVLAEHQPGLAHLLGSAGQAQIEVFPSFKQLPTARYSRSDGSMIPLHSRYDPLQEARQVLKNSDLAGADYFILLGFGLGYILDALLEQYGNLDLHYFVVESDPGILRAAFTARDWRPMLARHHLHFAHPAQGPALADQWCAFFNPVSAKKSVYITHAPSLALDPALFKSAVELIQSQTFQTFTDINTLVGKSEAFLDNFSENLPEAASAPGVAAFAGLFAHQPAVLVSAGPSLDKNVHELRGQEDNILILAADTALKPLLAAGVRPHFVITGDPSFANYLHLKGADAAGIFLVAEATAYPDIFSEFSGRIIACTYENSSLGCLSDLLRGKGTLRAWGSVATMGLDLALHLGCDPIIFVGQDLAHSEGRTYCSGVYFEERWFADVQEPGKWNQRLEEIRAGKKTIMVQDIFGRPAETTDKLSAYWNWISKELSFHSDVNFINATEGGILRENVTICSLREAVHRHSLPGRHPGKHIRRVFESAPRTKAKFDILLRLQQESAKVTESLESGGRFCRGPRNVPVSILREQLEAVKASIYANPHISPLLDSFNQMGNIAFLRSQDRLGQISARSGIGDEVRRVYGEYFNSVETAVAKVNRALNRLLSALQDSDPDSANIRGQVVYPQSKPGANNAMERRESAVL